MYYTLKWNGAKAEIVSDYLATGLFEDTVREFDTIWLDNILAFGYNSINIYPNPVENTLVISGEAEAIEKITVIIYDASGKVVFEKEENFPCELNVEQLTIGIYYIRVFENNKSLIFNKFIKK